MNRYEKAFKIFREFRVNPISYSRDMTSGYFEVEGDHGKYSVHIDEKGKGSCSCEGNSLYGQVCSHIIAVYFWLAVYHYSHSKTQRASTRKILKKVSEIEEIINFYNGRKLALMKMLEAKKKLKEEERNAKKKRSK